MWNAGIKPPREAGSTPALSTTSPFVANSLWVRDIDRSTIYLYRKEIRSSGDFNPAIYGLIRTGRISSIISTEVKTAEETAKRVRTGVGWMGLSGKLYEKRAVRVRYNPPRGQAPLYKAMRVPTKVESL